MKNLCSFYNAKAKEVEHEICRRYKVSAKKANLFLIHLFFSLISAIFVERTTCQSLLPFIPPRASCFARMLPFRLWAEAGRVYRQRTAIYQDVVR